MSLGVGFDGLTLLLVCSLCFLLAIEDMDSLLPTPYLMPATCSSYPSGTTVQIKVSFCSSAMVCFVCV